MCLICILFFKTKFFTIYVSYASLRRFEETGNISLSSLLKIANAFNTLKDFDYLFQDEIILNLKEYNEK